MPGANELDLILETRLDVLTQAVEEVNCVITEMEVQTDRLGKVDEFLSEAGASRQAEDNLLQHIGDVNSRVEVLLGSPTPSVPPVIRPGLAHRPPPSLSDADRQRLNQVQRRAESAREEIKKLQACRREIYDSFQDVWRWSVAGLGGPALREAAEDYRGLIRQIRNAENPWRSYQSEMPHLGHELFSRYLELLAGLAMRGFGFDSTVQSDADALIKQLKGPEGAPTESLRSPLALMSSLGRRHMPLGYPEWSLWALPLLGRAAGEEVVASLLPVGVDNRLRIICTDLYAQYVLGPSYLHAAIFLEFDPSPDPPAPNTPSDPLRATVLLWNLREYGADNDANSQLLEGIAAAVEREWQRARTAVGGQELDLGLDPEDREVVDRFLKVLKHDYVERVFPVDNLVDHRDLGRELTTTGQDESEPRIHASLRDLMSAMWLARLKEPSKARLIHRRAKNVSRLPDTPRNRVGLGASPRGGTWV